MKPSPAWWIAAAAAALTGPGGAVADDQPALVSVTIINVVDDVARNIGIESSQVPLNVQVPLDVAAAVCALPPETLSQQATSGVAQCTARNTAPGLDRAVQRQVRGNAQK